MSWPDTVRREDLRIDYYRGSGPGGQHRNKTDSACRITHLPTGKTAQCEDQRHQPQNRAKAFRRLCRILVPMMREAAQPERHEPSTERVRTYNEVRGTVKDHRTGKTFDYRDVVLGRGLKKVIG